MKKLVFIGALPQPLHGMSAINRKMLDYFCQEMSVLVFNLVPSFAARLYPGKAWVIAKSLWLVPVFLHFALRSLLRAGSDNLYFSIAGGMGKWLEMPFMLVAGFCYPRIYVHHHTFAYCNHYHRSMALLHRLGRGRITHIALCEVMKEHLVARYAIPAAAITVLSNTALTGLVPEPHGRERLQVIGFLGNITPAKGIREFIETFRRLQQGVPALKGIIAGPCMDAATRLLVDEALASLPGLEYRGAVYNDSKQAFFRDIDVLLFPSHMQEAEPVTIYEAFASNVPVVAWARGCIPAMVSNGSGVSISADADFVPAAVAILQQWCDTPALFRSQVDGLAARLGRLQEGEQHKLELLRAAMAAEGLPG